MADIVASEQIASVRVVPSVFIHAVAANLFNSSLHTR